jgi:two-component system chemotaxis response regulator CheY
MDIMMPEMDGHMAVREIRALEAAGGTLSTNRVKIIMTTALDDAKNVALSIKASCDAYLLKPIDRGKLVGHIRDLHLVWSVGSPPRLCRGGSRSLTNTGVDRENSLT